MYVNDQQTNWYERLPLIPSAINSSVNRTTTYSPFYLVHGREPSLPIESRFSETEFEDLNTLLSSLAKAREIACDKIEIGQITNAAYHDESRQTHTFSILDLVVCCKLAR